MMIELVIKSKTPKANADTINQLVQYYDLHWYHLSFIALYVVNYIDHVWPACSIKIRSPFPYPFNMNIVPVV